MTLGRKATAMSPVKSKRDPHMDLQIRWKNFRPFGDTDWLTVRPLTVLIGPNSSGKSSITAPLLLLNQTMLSRDLSSPLVSQGPLFGAPSFEGLLRNHNRRLEMFFGLRFHMHRARGEELGSTIG